MAEINQCDRFCPRKAWCEAQYREDAANAGLLQKAKLVAAFALVGVEQVARAATCPVRDNPAENWQPHENCVNAVRKWMAERTLDQTKFTPHERGILQPIIDQNPPAIEA